MHEYSDRQPCLPVITTVCQPIVPSCNIKERYFNFIRMTRLRGIRCWGISQKIFWRNARCETHLYDNEPDAVTAETTVNVNLQANCLQATRLKQILYPVFERLYMGARRTTEVWGLPLREDSFSIKGFSAVFRFCQLLQINLLGRLH